MPKEIPVAEVTAKLNGVTAAACGRITRAAMRLRKPCEIPQSAVAELLENLAHDLEGDVERLHREPTRGHERRRRVSAIKLVEAPQGKWVTVCRVVRRGCRRTPTALSRVKCPAK